MDEHDLRTLLRDVAGRGGTVLLDDDAATDAVVATHRTRRRRRAGLAAVAIAVAVVAAGTPLLLGDRTGPTPEVAAPAGPSVLDWPVRGSLAGNAAALETVRRLPWNGYAAAPDPDDRQVLFLGDVRGQRWALVAGRSGGRVLAQWFAGPAGADPGALVPDSGSELADGVDALSHATSANPYALVLAAPGTTLEASRAVVVDADGSVRRDFAPVDTVDGVAVVHVGLATTHSTALAYRVLRDGTVVARGGVLVPFGAEDVFDPPQLTPLDPSSAPPVPEAVDQALGAVLATTGLREEDLRLELLWSGPVPVRGTVPGSPDGVVLAATLPSGAVVVSLAWADMEPTGEGSAASCGAQAHPAGSVLAELGIAAECSLTGAGGAEARLLVAYAPPDAARLVVLRADGAQAAEASGGAGPATVAPSPGPGTLRIEWAGARPLELGVVTGQALVDRAGHPAAD
ncbi:hypothetical protein ACWKWC_11145 [Geodermatophilus nigrescens]